MTESILHSDNSDRLDRIERIVESMATGQVQTNHTVNQLSQIQLRMMEELGEHRRNMLEMRADMQEMRADMREIRADMREMRADMQEMQSEVRGLQTENSRILDRLFNDN
jgi:predicted nuclease with TOPRIM domain